MAKLIDLLTTDEEVVNSTNYSVAEMWEKRPYLSGSIIHEESLDGYADVEDTDDSNQTIIENTGIDSPAVEIRPNGIVKDRPKLAHIYSTHVTSAHDYNMLAYSYNALLNGNNNIKSEDALNKLKEFAMSNYDKVVNNYVAACEKGLCQALSNQNGWIVPAKANQERFSYNPGILTANTYTGTLTDFDTTSPEVKLLEDLVLKAQSANLSPDVIFVGDAVAKAIMQSSYYNTNNRVAPSSTSFDFTPAMSNNMIRAKGALELVGINVSGCKVMWINSMTMGVFNFQPNCAVALNSNLWASIFSGPTYANLGVHNDIIRFAPGTVLNEKEIRYFYEYSYLPTIKIPTKIYRIYYN